MTDQAASPRRTQLRSTLAVRDLIGEAGAAITRRPGRSLLTALGTVVGVGAFVATTGLASTAKAQVSERFDALAATQVRVVDSLEVPFGGDPAAGIPRSTSCPALPASESAQFIARERRSWRSHPPPSRRRPGARV